MSDRLRRRVLYGLTVWAWAGVGHFAWVAMSEGMSNERGVWLWLLLAVASCLFTASLFVAFLHSHDKVYRAGIEAGQRHSGCMAFRPALSAVTLTDRNVVTPIRSSRTDA